VSCRVVSCRVVSCRVVSCRSRVFFLTVEQAHAIKIVIAPNNIIIFPRFGGFLHQPQKRKPVRV
jgi:hypothetical protein